MKEEKGKRSAKLDKIDCYISRYREYMKLQDELEKKRKNTFVGYIFRKADHI